jgi:hypothetical protein
MLQNAVKNTAFVRAHDSFLGFPNLEKFVAESLIKGHPVTEGLSIMCNSG